MGDCGFGYDKTLDPTLNKPGERASQKFGARRCAIRVHLYRRGCKDAIAKNSLRLVYLFPIWAKNSEQAIS
jgi:hypothetical protein